MDYSNGSYQWITSIITSKAIPIEPFRWLLYSRAAANARGNCGSPDLVICPIYYGLGYFPCTSVFILSSTEFIASAAELSPSQTLSSAGFKTSMIFGKFFML